MVQRVIIYGGKGALGSAAIATFKSLNWWVLAIDLEFSGANIDADARVLIKDANLNSLLKQSQQVLQDTQSALGADVKVNAIICVAGGWSGGNAKSEDLSKSTDAMLKQSVWPSIICSRLAALHLSVDGLVVLTGAKAALDATPSMIGYGLAKAAIHQLVKSLANSNSGLPEKVCVLAILPVTLDTPMNRKWMPNENQSNWTPLELVTHLFAKWASGIDDARPKSGSMVILEGSKICIVNR